MLALKGCDTSRSRPTPTTSLPAESLKSTEVFWSSASRGPDNTVAQMHFAFGSTLARSARFDVFPRCHSANEDLEVRLGSSTSKSSFALWHLGKTSNRALRAKVDPKAKCICATVLSGPLEALDQNTS